MDWELKESSWDFSNVGAYNDHNPRLPTIIGSNSLNPNNNGVDFSIDLNLGSSGKVQKYPSNEYSSPSGSSKRGRAISGTQNATCLVDGCTDDLSGCREYHRRHRVCERHSKTPVVTIGGKEKRFCQQCSRFQCLTEFDEEKRSCRKRLDGHNRRRRKPQPEAFYMNHSNFYSNNQGTRVMQFGSPEAYTTSAVPTWPSSSTFHNVSSSDRRFPFLLTNNNNHHTVPQLANIHSRTAHDSPFANVSRSHSLLSSPRPIQNPMFISSSANQGPTHDHYLVPQTSNYQNSYRDISMASLSPDNLLEKGASHVLPFSWN